MFARFSALFGTGPGRVSWRRLLVLALACAALFLGKIDAWAWVAVAIAFIGGDSAERVAQAVAKRAGLPLPSVLEPLAGDPTWGPAPAPEETEL